MISFLGAWAQGLEMNGVIDAVPVSDAEWQALLAAKEEEEVFEPIGKRRTCSLCEGQLSAVERVMNVEERATGPAFKVQKWSFCTTCWVPWRKRNKQPLRSSADYVKLLEDAAQAEAPNPWTAGKGISRIGVTA